MTIYHITVVSNGFILDTDGDEVKQAVFQRENADEMFEVLARLLQVHDLIYSPQTGGQEEQKTPAPFTITDPDI